MTDIQVLFTTPAHTLVEGDQIIVDGDLCVIRQMDFDREDIDEIHVWVDNLSGGEDEFDLFADDEFEVWSI